MLERIHNYLTHAENKDRFSKVSHPPLFFIIARELIVLFSVYLVRHVFFQPSISVFLFRKKWTFRSFYLSHNSAYQLSNLLKKKKKRLFEPFFWFTRQKKTWNIFWERTTIKKAEFLQCLVKATIICCFLALQVFPHPGVFGTKQTTAAALHKSNSKK